MGVVTAIVALGGARAEFVGMLTVSPGAANVVPGDVALSLDVRHIEVATGGRRGAALGGQADRAIAASKSCGLRARSSRRRRWTTVCER
jgi:hypothetical protein